MRRRTIRLIGYPVAAYFGGLAAWGRALEAVRHEWSAPDVLFGASLMGVMVAGIFVFVTEAFACNIGEEAPRG